MPFKTCRRLMKSPNFSQGHVSESCTFLFYMSIDLIVRNFVRNITDINYFHCLRIVEILKDTEASSKNIFGYYSSQRMKDWQEILKLYDKNNIYLGKSSFPSFDN